MKNSLLDVFVLLIGYYHALFIGSSCAKTYWEVETSKGKVEGRQIRTKSGYEGWAFQGIPYAQPPVGSLRFLPPRNKQPWTGKLLCNRYKPACWQNVSGTGQTVESVISENCLFLNVFVGPECLTRRVVDCPVILYIHGGGNEFDSPRMFSPETLLENFASKMVVLVTVSYRLNVFGFWTTATLEAPGNLAYHDMIKSAQWIKDEIGNFGGDPSRVTLQGHSSSAMAISLLSMSPATEGLFQQIVMMSGSACKRYEAVSDNVDHYGRLAEYLNCTTREKWEKRRQENALDILSCMQKVNADTLGNAFNRIRGEETATGNSRQMTLARIDGPGGLFPYPLLELIAKRRPIKAITGTTSKEVSYLKVRFQNATQESLEEACRVFVTNQAFSNTEVIVQQCVDYYSRNDTENDERFDRNKDLSSSLDPNITVSFWGRQIIKLSADVQYYSPSYLEASSLAAKGAQVYLYSFDYVKKGLEEYAPYHAMDMAYLIGLHADKYELDERDRQISEIYVSLFVNFAHYGDPTPSDRFSTARQFESVWRPLPGPLHFDYFSVDLPRPIMRPHYHENAALFWNFRVPLVDHGLLAYFSVPASTPSKFVESEFVESESVESENSSATAYATENESATASVTAMTSHRASAHLRTKTKRAVLIGVLIFVLLLLIAAGIAALALDRWWKRRRENFLLRSSLLSSPLVAAASSIPTMTTDDGRRRRRGNYESLA